MKEKYAEYGHRRDFNQKMNSAVKKSGGDGRVAPLNAALWYWEGHFDQTGSRVSTY